MEKYTVDLDKVLNDFEYSELTEQNNGYFNNQTSYNSAVNQKTNGRETIDHQPYPKLPVATAKHSINNVFHSLNEYLNTDIKSDLNNASSSVSEINEIENVPTLVRKSSTESPSIEEIFKSIAKDENIVESVNSNLEENILEVDKIEVPKTVNNNIDSKNLNTDNLKILNNNDETSETNSEVVPEANIPSTIVSVDDDKIEVTIIQQEPIKFGDLDLSDTELETELAELEQEFEDNNQEEQQKDLKAELEEITETDSNKKPEEVEKIPENHQDGAETIEKETEPVIVETIECDTQETQVEVQVQDCDNVNNEEICDESVDKSVKVSENTENEGVNNVESKNEEVNNVESKNEEVNNVESKNEVVEEVEDIKIERRGSIRPSSLDLNAETSGESLTINLIGEPGSTPYNNTYTLPTTSTPTIPPPTSSPPTTPSQPPPATSLSPTQSESDASVSSTYDNSQSDTATSSDTSNTSGGENDTSLEEGGARGGDNAAGESRGEERPEGGEGQEGGVDVSWLGKTAPFWTPDSDALCCLHCNQKFTVIKRRHHCRACGLVLCSKCCNMKCKLEYMENTEARVCLKCFEILTKEAAGADSTADRDPGRVLRPQNPMDYCSTVPPHQQVSNAGPQQPPSVLVPRQQSQQPVSVLKRQGSGKSRPTKSVIFCDGIRPGCDLTELDNDFNYRGPPTSTTCVAAVSDAAAGGSAGAAPPAAPRGPKGRGGARNAPKLDGETGSYVPKEEGALPPVVSVVKSDILYGDCANNPAIVDMLRAETLTFALQRNLHVHVRIINMDCCINKQAWCFSTEGMITVGQDEIVILLEVIENEKSVPKDVFLHLNHVYQEAVKGTSIPEMGISIHPTSNFLESKNHAGFLYIKPTFQCIQNVLVPKEPYLIGVLMHRWETPWAKIFPLRLLLRLGAEYRYYPAPIISTRHRESVYVEIGHTIINLLADFRNFSYSLPVIRGLTVHMEDKRSVVRIPRNRYEALMRALNNASDHILALAASFSTEADAHLVSIQDTRGSNENSYTTHAINIHNKPRKVTGASFIVLNGALKSSSGFTAKSSIVEDGLMVQIPSEQMSKLRTALRNMSDFSIQCGPAGGTAPGAGHVDETVCVQWVEDDVNFNVSVTSPIDGMSLSGVPSIRVHNGRDFVCNSGNKMIRWTEVFIIQSGEESVGNRTSATSEPVDVSRVSEAISKATSQALVKYLDLLATNSQVKIAIRVQLNIENVSYLAGSNGTKLPPIYMKSLDNELIPVLHRLSAGFGEHVTVALELMFHILNCS